MIWGAGGNRTKKNSKALLQEKNLEGLPPGKKNLKHLSKEKNEKGLSEEKEFGEAIVKKK